MRIHGIGGNCVFWGPILIPEWTEPILGNFRPSFGGKFAYPDFLGLIALILSRQLFCFQNSTKFLCVWIDILYVLLFLYRNKNRRNSPKRMCPKAS